ncbi:MAG: cytochrome C [Cytophagaceae bacterium]|nr:MAG: cytochrome C [Cytophagaceae bacterium]
MGRHKAFNFSFLWIIAAAGLFTLMVIAGNLGLLGLHRFPGEPRHFAQNGSKASGKHALQKFGCGACHVIPGVSGAMGRVGPSLKDFDRQIVLAGSMPNTPENLILWLLDPQSLNPKTLMPNLNVSLKEAEDMAAYLYD